MNANKKKAAKKPEMKAGERLVQPQKVKSTPFLQKLHLEALNPTYLIILGLLLLLILVGLFFLGGSSQKDDDAVLEQAKTTLSQFSASVQSMRRILVNEQVQARAANAIADPGQLTSFREYMSGRVPDFLNTRLFGPDLNLLRGSQLGDYGYAVLDMLMKTQIEGTAPVQIHGVGEGSYVALATTVTRNDEVLGFLFLEINPEVIAQAFAGAQPETGNFALDQYNGRFQPTTISALATTPSKSERIMWLRIPNALFRVGVVQANQVSGSLDVWRPVLFVSGLLLLILGIMLKIRPYTPPVDLEAEKAVWGVGLVRSKSTPSRQKAKELPDLGVTLEKPNMPQHKESAPVELLDSIFRAYDIRGIVGETLDADVARRVGQVVGSLAREQDAGPVIVARDGRDSGPALVQGMIGGIISTGCDVVNIGAVPTGVLYYAAYELSKGTGVMITGSHNPPNYNGFKMLIGGVTQSGEQITDIYKRIKNNDIMIGNGQVSEEEMISRYRERISSDIFLARPLKVVADCGNGIGGVCAADILRDIGAVVTPLFDEVDGNFPNHHPDPSDPKNLLDLISSVRALDADIGVAFDGDADRLGVVTASGDIIYSDRLMMLFIKDVLSREPGSTIIYDVKCTGHLKHVIEEAGGVPMMYKTGHSLIKNKMKEVDAPFAGEMSGHFFFKERWYGFDCGIYAAARLLEILAKDERSPTEVLNSLPNSFSTPELKVEMKEGENHAFVKAFQKVAEFEGATVNTIDGVRADFPDGWGLVRASNTTPILVCRFDADSKQLLERISHIFKRQMLQVNRDLKLPF